MRNMIGQMAAGVSVLSDAATLTKIIWAEGAEGWTQTAEDHAIKAGRLNMRRPSTQPRVKDPDAVFNVFGVTVEQNDLLTIGEKVWLVWSVQESPAGSHARTGVVSLPTTEAALLVEVKTPDGGGGYTKEFPAAQDAPKALGYFTRGAVDRNAGVEGTATANDALFLTDFHTLPVDLATVQRVSIAGQSWQLLGWEPVPDNLAFYALRLGTLT